ncbi:hypothetical protein DQP55_23085 [Mycolicibacterium sp. GF69]|uniref:Uncharacterized protein n=3 Tax=Mycolicibacterium TaxID=1866885 RepID=A0A5S9P8I7_MYCVN|nr:MULTISPECIES: hypothetical protein [Mycolicibacterium]MBU8817601.1 hypothetical protein [Mycolicibacterium goodii]ORB61315.1 hypothetical protein BST47_28340 [Mycolicibacterium tusciae]RAV06948.1 hypothetical protein DQP55_23085 [Mycolicibacterium sp. GF69]CAA0099884.1 Uncharacterised protein [Mycolicibacterium vanbaalenii]
MSEDKNNEDRIEFEMSTTSTNRNTLVPDVEGVLDAQLAAICVALNQRPSVEPRLTAIAAASQYREKLRKAMARQADEDRETEKTQGAAPMPPMPQVPCSGDDPAQPAIEYGENGIRA